MSKTRRVLYNTLTAALNMVVNQILSLVVSIKVLEVYGADYHGLNSILSNVMTWILLIESGLTTASTVALYKPFMSKDYDRCNRILSASRIKFHQIGGIIFLVGVGVAAIYPFFLKTEIPYWDICLMFLIMTCSTSFGVFYTRKCSIMYSVTQSEYLSQLITIGISIVGNAAVYFATVNHAHYLWIRTIYLLITIATGITLAIVIKHQHPFINYHAEPDHSAIKGTKDVVVQKLTSVIRSSTPALFISVFDNTTAASVYAVNMYGYNFVRSIMQNVLGATQSGIGQVVAEKNRTEVNGVFRIFEYIMTTVVIWLMTVAIAVTIPFVNYYTRNVPNIDYINYFLWLIIPFNYTIQVLHLPSGVVINMYARFKEDKNFQIASICVMLAAMALGGWLYGLNGIMAGVTAGSITLAVQEIRFAHRHLLHTGYSEFFRPILIDLAILLPVMAIEYAIIPKHVTLIQFFAIGILVAVIHGVCIAGVNYLFERERMLAAITRFTKLFGKRKRV